MHYATMKRIQVYFTFIVKENNNFMDMLLFNQF